MSTVIKIEPILPATPDVTELTSRLRPIVDAAKSFIKEYFKTTLRLMEIIAEMAEAFRASVMSALYPKGQVVEELEPYTMYDYMPSIDWDLRVDANTEVRVRKRFFNKSKAFNIFLGLHLVITSHQDYLKAIGWIYTGYQKLVDLFEKFF